MQLSLGCVLGNHPFVEAILVLDMPYVCVKGAKVIPQLTIMVHCGCVFLFIPHVHFCLICLFWLPLLSHLWSVVNLDTHAYWQYYYDPFH